MRLHTLELTAFGPFGGTVVVDFDRLSDANVFLLCGDTGAGKSTVLDGVCFALYGDVPSARATAKQLRSQHAEEGVAPAVVLEVTLAGRRFRFTRSPAWQRPKRRGAGTTTEQARVTVEERVGDEWVLRTSRLDEAGHLVGDLVGMTLTQFSQVALLPQGQFDRFLRSSSEERQKVLTRLFQTDRFERVEHWFVERRQQLARAHRRHNGRVASVLHRLSEAAATGHPEGWDDADLAAPVADGRVRAWTDGLLREAEDACGLRAEAAARAAAVRAGADAALRAARTLHEQQQRYAAAVGITAELAASAPAADSDRQRLAAARRAAPVVPLARLADQEATARDRAAAGSARAVGELAGHLDPLPVDVGIDDLAAHEERVRTAVAAARAFLPRAGELERARADAVAVAARIGSLTTQLAESGERLAALPGRRAVLVGELDECRRLAALLVTREAAVTGLVERLAATRAAAEVAALLATARVAEDELARSATNLREHWLTLRERRLEGIAAELASAMAVGAHCPVCGSTEHPAPAPLAADAPTRADESAARRAFEDADVALLAQRDQVRGLELRAEAARAAGGDQPADQVAAELEAQRAAVRAAGDAARRLPGLGSALGDLDDELARLGRDTARQQAELESSRRRAGDLATTVTTLSTELAALLGNRADGLESLIAGHERLREVLVSARQALTEEVRCARAADEARTRAERAALEAGFADGASALGAHLPARDLETLEDAIRARDRRERDVAAVLADPDLVAVAAEGTPDLAALAEAGDAAERASRDAAAAARVAEQARARLHELTADLDTALEAWAPVRAEHGRVRALAELVEGKGSENTPQMRLSAYVLSARLTQVVAAANERLGRMLDDRYVLEHAEHAAGDRRGGLSIAVRDQWTGDRRDPVTLSGGETFVVSLALALGLADVVTAEAGGTRIDTLFVDEGFGSLDAETLEEVMDVLDGLREGGRAVGVVSHVAELRDRITTRLEVRKGRAGSHVLAH